jgi:WD40 repeat protein
VATLGWNAVGQLWDAKAGTEVGNFRLSQPGHNNWLVLTPDGKYFVAWDGAGMIDLRDGRTGESVRRIDAGGYDAGYNYGDFSPDGSFLVVNRGATVKFWDIPAGKPKQFANVKFDTQTHHTSAQLADGGNTLVTGAYRGGLERMDQVWDLTGQAPPRRLTGFDRGNVWARLLLAPGGDHAVLSGGNKIEVLNWRTDKMAAVLKAPEGKSFTALAFTPDGKRLATADSGGRVTLLELPGGKECASFSASTGAVTALAFSGDGKTLATAAGATVTLWNADEALRGN